MHREKTEKKKRNKLILAGMAPFQIILSLLICMALVIYGPFSTVRDTFIGTAMSTSTHQYLATMFFPKKEIDAVMSRGGSVKAQAQDVSKLDAKSPSGSNKVTLEQITSSDGKYAGYLIEIANPLRVKLACTKYLGVRGETVSTFSKETGALAAINGGGFSYYTPTMTIGKSSYSAPSMAFSNGSMPSDFVVVEGKVVWKNPDYSDADPNPSCTVALDRKGTLIVGDKPLSELQKMKAQYAVTMPGYEPLIVDGKATYTDQGKTSFAGVQPRTVIGQKADKTILMLVIDGRSVKSFGAGIADVTKIMLDHGAVTAANLDGGYSSTMVYNGKVVSHPDADYGERTVPTAFYVTK